MLLSIGFPYIIPKEIYNRHPIALNIHPTLLPHYRGPTTGAYIIMNNEKFSGSTIHLMNEKVDSGPIISQFKISLTSFDTIRSMQRKVYDAEPFLLLDAIKRLDQGFKPQPQNEFKATYYSKKRLPKDSQINPEKTLNQLFNEIRACDPDDFPAFFFYEGQKVCIRLWRPEKSKDEDDMI